jgi:ankyrin repeat protein
VVEYLLQEQVDPNLKTGPYGSGFLSAVASSNVAVVKVMLPSGADVHTPGNGNVSALAIAIHYGCSALIPLLLEPGADIQLPFKYYGISFDNALEFVAHEGTFEMSQQKIGMAKSYVSSPEMNGVFMAAMLEWRREGRQIITWLLEAGVDVNMRRGTSTADYYRVEVRSNF